MPLNKETKPTFDERIYYSVRKSLVKIRLQRLFQLSGPLEIHQLN